MHTGQAPSTGPRSPIRLLVVDDDPDVSTLLSRYFSTQGFAVSAAASGAMLRRVLADQPVDLVLLDLGLPGEDGFALTRYLHEHWRGPVIIVSGRGESVDRVVGLELGADDYITKPFDRDELHARVNVGLRMAALQQSLAERVAELEDALKRVKQLQGLLPICCYCKCIRNDGNYWQRVEEYIGEHSDARFSHGICPKCFDTVVKAQLREQGVSVEGLDIPDKKELAAPR